MFKKLKFIIYTRPFIAFVYYFVRMYSLTFRVTVKNDEHWQKHLKKGDPILLCTWHQQFFSAIYPFRIYGKYHPAIMISQSRDGKLISGVANRFGWDTQRGSSSRGGKKAMEMMIRHLKTHGFGAHILDGPTGPMGKVKPGIIKMAQETHAYVVPFYTRADHAWFFNSWDRFMVPKPFSKVEIRFGEEIRFDSTASSKGFERQRRHLEETMLPGLFLEPERCSSS